MPGGRFSVVAGFVLVVMLVAGCSGEEPTTPAAPAPPTAASESPSPEPTASPDPYAIPDDPADIDEAYVERVLEALSESTAAAAREVAREGHVTERAKELLGYSYRVGPALEGVVAAFEDAVEDTPGGEVFNPNAEQMTIDVRRLLTATSSCVFARVRQDTSDLVGQDFDPFVGYFHIEPKNPREDPEGGNPTPWMIVAEVGAPPHGEEYDDPCT